jgi:hypothetical protein
MRTSVALITAVTVSPTFSFICSADVRVIAETTSRPP